MTIPTGLIALDVIHWLDAFSYNLIRLISLGTQQIIDELVRFPTHVDLFERGLA